MKLGVLIGNVFHHYESSLFAWTAPFLAPLLFPEKEGAAALLLTFAFLPLSYVMKPVGALFWGWIGDGWGRKPAVTASLFGMAASTFAIGCLPLGSRGWIFLSCCRLLQGFFSAGEEKSAALYLLEQTAVKRRAWMSAVYDGSGIIGIFLASLLASHFGEAHWRFLFFLGGFSALVGVFLRHRAQESPEFKPARFSWKVIWDERRLIARIAIVSGFSYANYFLITVFLNGYLPKITALSKSDVLLFNTHLLWIDFLLLLGFGLLCQKIAKEKVMASAAALVAFLAMPLFATLEGASWTHAAIVRLIFIALGVALAAPYHAWKLEILPDKHRLLIGSLGSTLGSKLFGAPIPFIATFLATQTGLTWMAALPIVLLGLAALPLVLWKPLLAAKPLISRE